MKDNRTYSINGLTKDEHDRFLHMIAKEREEKEQEKINLAEVKKAYNILKDFFSKGGQIFCTVNENDEDEEFSFNILGDDAVPYGGDFMLYLEDINFYYNGKTYHEYDIIKSTD